MLASVIGGGTLLAIEISTEMQRAAEAVAAQWGASSALHEQDQLLRQVAKKWGPIGATERYLTGGRNDAAKIRAAIERLRIRKDRLRILDFAAGFGRVARHVKYLMPTHEICASDIHPEACRFMRERLEIESFCSVTEPEDLSIGGEYDVVYVMSLFSHLPDKSFGRWLAALYNVLAPGGHLVFTANGAATLALFPEFYGEIFGNGQQFGYREVSDQLDLDTKDYGSMIVSMRYVLDAMDRHTPTARLHGFSSGAWFGSQDEWILHKPA